MVWLPGGGFVEGSGGYRLYDGARLAAREDVVVVSLNYRVGALGFLGHPALARELGLAATPSFGLLDQQAALRWVHRNIAAFGGDPSLVTLFGPSAGAYSVCAQLAMPASRGLFARAILQSGACSGPLWFGRREAEAQGSALAQALHCEARREGNGLATENDLACLRRASVEEILQALPLKKNYVLAPGVWWGPVVDGQSLPRLPQEAFTRGEHPHVPVLLGWARDEGRMHTLGLDAVSNAERDSFVRDGFGERALGPVGARYGGQNSTSDGKAGFEAMMSDGAFACPQRRVARAFARQGTPVYVYELRHVLDAPVLHALGATHNVDLPLVFGTEEGVFRLSAREQPLSRLIMAALAQVVREAPAS